MQSVVTPTLGNPLLWLLLVMAVLLVRATQGQPVTRRRALVPLGLLWLLGCRPVAELFARPLESRYAQPSLASLAARDLHQVVVLTAGGWGMRGEITTSTLPDASAQRFLGGLELCTLLGPRCRLIFSGGEKTFPVARMMEQLARRLHPELEVVSESESAHTSDHPHNTLSLLDSEGFLLVTSAYHMPRAMRSFHKAGLQPTAYPVDFMVRGGYHWDAWLPTFSSGAELATVWREYLALIWYILCGL